MMAACYCTHFNCAVSDLTLSLVDLPCGGVAAYSYKKNQNVHARRILQIPNAQIKLLYK